MTQYIMTTTTLVLMIGWPLLIGGSLYVFFSGRRVYQQVKSGIVGALTKTLVVSMVVQMYSLGIIATALMFMVPSLTVPVVVPVFILWLLSFVWSLKELDNAKKEVEKITQQ